METYLTKPVVSNEFNKALRLAIPLSGLLWAAIISASMGRLSWAAGFLGAAAVTISAPLLIDHFRKSTSKQSTYREQDKTNYLNRVMTSEIVLSPDAFYQTQLSQGPVPNRKDQPTLH